MTFSLTRPNLEHLFQRLHRNEGLLLCTFPTRACSSKLYNNLVHGLVVRQTWEWCDVLVMGPCGKTMLKWWSPQGSLLRPSSNRKPFFINNLHNIFMKPYMSSWNKKALKKPYKDRRSRHIALGYLVVLEVNTHCPVLDLREPHIGDSCSGREAIRLQLRSTIQIGEDLLHGGDLIEQIYSFTRRKQRSRRSRSRSRCKPGWKRRRKHRYRSRSRCKQRRNRDDTG